jgi:hypothetical protein
MSDDNGMQGPPPQDIPDEAAQAAIGMVGSLIAGFARDMAENDVLQIAAGELSQQAQLGVVLTDALDDEKRAANPRFGFRIRDLRKNEIIAEIQAPKDLSKATSLNELKHGVDVIAYATSPAARAVLRAYGFSVEFFQKKATASSKVVLPS